MLLFHLFASKRVHNLSEHKLHRKEGAENDQEAEEKYRNGDWVRVHIVVHDKGPVLKGKALEDRVQWCWNIVEVNDIVPDQILQFGVVPLDRDAKVHELSTFVHLPWCRPDCAVFIGLA